MKTTFEKGDEFEQLVAERLRSELRNGHLAILPSQAEVIRKRKYYSQLRRDHIIVDVAIEVSRVGAASPFLIWIWECKDYANRVPIDDVEEFHSKLEQIGEHKTKGTIVSRNGFAKGSYEYAKSLGIGLVLMPNRGRLSYVLEDNGPLSLIEALEDVSPADLSSSFYGLMTNGFAMDSLDQFLYSELSQ